MDVKVGPESWDEISVCDCSVLLGIQLESWSYVGWTEGMKAKS